MPVYNSNGGMGRSGISGETPIILGTEIFSQNTFTPDHDKWRESEDLSFVDGILTYQTVVGSGGIVQNAENFNTPILVSDKYQFEWTLRNVDAGDLRSDLWSTTTDYYNALPLVEGTSRCVINLTNRENQVGVGFDGSSGSFEILKFSLKQLNNTMGLSGYSGEVGDVNLTPGVMVDNATAETIVVQFNALLKSLKDAGIMNTSGPT